MIESATTQHSHDDHDDDRMQAYAHIANDAAVRDSNNDNTGLYELGSGDTITVNDTEHRIAARNAETHPYREDYTIVLENYDVITVTAYPPIEGKNAYHITFEYHEHNDKAEHIEELNLATLEIDGEQFRIDSQPDRDIEQNTLGRYAD